MIFFLFVTFWKNVFNVDSLYYKDSTASRWLNKVSPCTFGPVKWLFFYLSTTFSSFRYVRIYVFMCIYLQHGIKKIAKRFVRNLLIYLVCSSSESFNQGLNHSITHTASRHCKFQCLLFGNRERLNLHKRTPSGNELYIYIITCSFYIWRRNVNNINLWKDPSVCTRRSDRKFKQIDTAGAADIHAQCLILRKIYFRPLYQSQP